MKRPKFVIPIVIAALIAIVVVLRSPVSPPRVTSDQSPSGQIREASPQQILDHVKGLKRPVVLVNLWASWCEPCKEEFPALLSLRKGLAAKGVEIVFVSIDEPKDLPAAEAFLHEQHVDFPTFYKGTQSLQFVTDLYPNWEGAVPTTMLFAPDLRILDAWEGDTTRAEFEKRISSQLHDQGKGKGT